GGEPDLSLRGRWLALERRRIGRVGDVLNSSPGDTFEAVVLPYMDAAHNLARWLMRDPASAEDVLQEAMLRAVTYFPSFKGVNPRGWLLQIVRNTAYASMNLNRGVELVPMTNAPDEANDVI